MLSCQVSITCTKSYLLVLVTWQDLPKDLLSFQLSFDDGVDQVASSFCCTFHFRDKLSFKRWRCFRAHSKRSRCRHRWLSAPARPVRSRKVFLRGSCHQQIVGLNSCALLGLEYATRICKKHFKLCWNLKFTELSPDWLVSMKLKSARKLWSNKLSQIRWINESGFRRSLVLCTRVPLAWTVQTNSGYWPGYLGLRCGGDSCPSHNPTWRFP